MKPPFSIEHDDLWSVFGALLEAKFHEKPFDLRIGPSPILARVMDQMVDALYTTHTDRSKEEMERWRQLTPDRREWQVALSHMHVENEWMCLSDDERIEYARNLLSPYRLSEELLRTFIEEALALGKGSR